MDELIPVSVVHFYDVRLRMALCGLRGFEHRSTKHARGVTCAACAGLLHRRLAAEMAVNEDSGSGPASSA